MGPPLYMWSSVDRNVILQCLTIYKHEWDGVVLHVFLEEKYLGSDIQVSCSKVSVEHCLSFLEYDTSLEHFFLYLHRQRVLIIKKNLTEVHFRFWAYFPIDNLSCFQRGVSYSSVNIFNSLLKNIKNIRNDRV